MKQKGCSKLNVLQGCKNNKQEMKQKGSKLNILEATIDTHNVIMTDTDNSFQLSDYAKSHQYRSIMCYVIQREDVKSFAPSVIDPTYRECFYSAQGKGVEMYAVQYKWDKDGKAYLLNDQLDIVGAPHEAEEHLD